MPTERGEYRPIFTRILNGPAFQALGSDARHLLYAIKLSLPAAGIAVLPGMVGQLAEATALTEGEVGAALQELRDGGWVACERNVIWLVRGLEFEPTLNHQNAKHREHIRRAIDGLPSLSIVERFRAHYADWFDENGKAPESPSKASGSTTPTPSPTPSPKNPPATQSAGAAVENSREGEPHTMNSVLALVVQKLYFGTRPSRSERKVNGSVLKRLHERGQSWDLLARAVEGLGLRRDRGEIQSIPRTSPVSCKWLWDKDQTLNQVAVSEDTIYRPDPGPLGRKRGGMSRVGQVIGRVG